MADRRCPAAYIRAPAGDARGLARQYRAVAEGTRQRGWPPAVIYADDGADPARVHAPQLARVAAAIEAGRHDALLIPWPGAAPASIPPLMGLLLLCSRNGVTVAVLLPPPLTSPE